MIRYFLLPCAALMIGDAGAFPTTLEPLHITGSDPITAGSPQHLPINHRMANLADAAAAFTHQPGAAIQRNGPQTGILQLRGLSGNRIGIQVDGMTITPACPNHMDPPLHYAQLDEGGTIRLHAGIAPVTAGGDSIAGAVAIEAPKPVFASASSSPFRGSLASRFSGDQHASLLRATAQQASEKLAFRYSGSAAKADDLRYSGGRAADTGYEVTRQQSQLAWRTPHGFLALDAGWSATRDAGTPALAMDMIRDDAWNLGIRQQEQATWGNIEQHAFVHDIDHLMDNFSLRPTAGMRMEAPSSSRDYGWRGAVSLPRGDSTVNLGMDLHRNEFDAEQVAVDSGLRRDMFHNAARGRYGAFADLEHRWSDSWSGRIGTRGDWVVSNADEVRNQIMPMGAILADQTLFNTSDRSKQEFLLDLMAALRLDLDERNAFEWSAAVKHRAPSILERYLWTPLSASAGQADGRTYLGDPNLDPEESWQIAVSYEHQQASGWLKMTTFYQHVADFIQGMPIARNDTNGLPVLQYQNLDRVMLYGGELSGGLHIDEHWKLEASVSHVRGRNEENGDDLYRIAPLHGRMDVIYELGSWQWRVESEWAAAQKHVSTTQGETPSPGFGIFHARLQHQLENGTELEVGVENLLNKRYAAHLGGVNRVAGGDLAVGERIPGAGRFPYMALRWKF